jgi:hypothetical protein
LLLDAAVVAAIKDPLTNKKLATRSNLLDTSLDFSHVVLVVDIRRNNIERCGVAGPDDRK